MNLKICANVDIPNGIITFFLLTILFIVMFVNAINLNQRKMTTEETKKVKEEIEDIIEGINDINKRVLMASEFIKILFKGHKTERRHRNIYNFMFKKLCKFSKEIDKQKLKEKNEN